MNSNFAKQPGRLSDQLFIGKIIFQPFIYGTRRTTAVTRTNLIFKIYMFNVYKCHFPGGTSDLFSGTTAGRVVAYSCTWQIFFLLLTEFLGPNVIE